MLAFQNSKTRLFDMFIKNVVLKTRFSKCVFSRNRLAQKGAVATILVTMVITMVITVVITMVIAMVITMVITNVATAPF